MRNSSLSAFGSGGGTNPKFILRPSNGVPKLAALTTIIGHTTTDVWVDDPDYGILATVPLLMGGIQCRLMALKNLPYTIVIGCLTQAGPTGNVGWGMALRDSVTGKFIALGTMRNLPTVNAVALTRWTDVDTFTAPYGGYGSTTAFNTPIWWKLADDGTNRNWYSSTDGSTWLPLGSEASGTFIQPNQAGIYVLNNANAGSPVVNLTRFFELTVT